MRLKCVICQRAFPSKIHSNELEEGFCNIASTFCNYLMPNSGVNFGGPLQFCCSCRLGYLKQVHERQAKMVQLSSRIKQNYVSNLKGLLVQNHAEFLKNSLKLLNESRISSSSLPAQPVISAEIFVGDSSDMKDTTGNATGADETHEDVTPVLPIFSVDHVTKSTCENTSCPPPSAPTGLENKGSEVCAAATAQHAIFAQSNAAVTSSDPVEKQTDRVRGFEALSSSSSQHPADCLTYQGIPYKQLPYGEGYRCCACKNSKSKPTLSGIKYHIRRVHLGKPPSKKKLYVIEDKKTEQIRYLGKYICHKLPDGSFKCGSCDYPAKKKLSSVLGHLRMTHAGAAKRSRRLVEVSPDKFEYYGLTAERRKDGLFLCGSCHFSTKSMKRLFSHLWAKRKIGISRICEVCGKVFKTIQSFYLHRRTHPTGEEQKCAQCGRSFDTKSKLSSHIQKVHRQPARLTKPPKVYVCEFCGKEYKAKDSFDSHMNVYHSSNPETFECKVCGKSYASVMARRVHMNSHTAKKDYSCDICGMKFTQAYSVVRHKNVAHKET